MDKRTLQHTILETAYNRGAWLDVLKEFFSVKKILQQPINIPIDITKAEYAIELGSFITADDREVGIFEVKLLPQVWIERNRVGLRNLLRKVYKYNVDGALIVFVQENKWRFSYVSEIRTEEGKKETEPKRYTYLFGQGESCRTAADRFDKLNGKPLFLNDLFEAFSVETLTKEFYKELFDWYQWAQSENIGITFPNDISTTNDDRIISEHLIRLITRLMFVWFIKRKDLIPESIFDKEKLSEILNNFKPLDYKQDSFYRAILQNLFFATLNKKIEEREFATDATYNENKEHYGVKNLYRYTDEFKIDQQQVLSLFSDVPFLNGGLFECLDKEKPDSKGKIVYSDGFSRRKDRQSRAFVPNIVFFEDQKGLLNILKRYNFTIEENSPQEIQVALDPELLGKVFENLLGTFNPETKETARKLSGSFYTPREIVDYMVNESLIAYLINKEGETFESDIKDFVNNTEISENLSKIKFRISNALREIKVLDPACGSGAFPMGLLNKMVDLLSKLENHEADLYDLKLHLIENCIYGIDIQTIAAQISKLRFFISLIINQEKDSSKDNFGILPLPNLETKFVAANTLINLKKNDNQLNLFEDPEVEKTKMELFDIRHKHFSATNSKDKKKFRQEDERLRDKLADLFEQNQFYSHNEARLLSTWNPYDQNISSPFFDPEWMFNIKDGFDVVIGNPPYVQLQKDGGKLAEQFKNQKYSTFERTGDIYSLFYERGYALLKNKGFLTYITSNKWMRTNYGKSTRRFFTEKTSPLKLIDFGNVQIFENATVDTNILMLQKAIHQKKFKACRFTETYIKGSSIDTYINKNTQFISFKSDDAWVISESANVEIIEKVRNQGIPLKNWNITINYGIKTGLNEAFVIDSKTKEMILGDDPKSIEILKPILRGKDIQKWLPEYANLYLITSHNGHTLENAVDVNKYLAIKNWLDSNEPKLSNRSDSGKTPYNLRDCAYWQDFEKPKIIYPNMTKYLPFVYDENEHYYHNDKSFHIVGEGLKWLVAFLNSTLFKFTFSDDFPELQGGTREVRKIFFEKVPVKNITLKEQKPIELLVNQILAAKKTNPQADTSTFEQQIDNLVYKLYELTYEDVLVIEPNFAEIMSKEAYNNFELEK